MFKYSKLGTLSQEKIRKIANKHAAYRHFENIILNKISAINKANKYSNLSANYTCIDVSRCKIIREVAKPIQLRLQCLLTESIRILSR